MPRIAAKQFCEHNSCNVCQLAADITDCTVCHVHVYLLWHAFHQCITAHRLAA
jgi:hypothetical protein